MSKTICTILLLFHTLFLFAQKTYKQNIEGLVALTFPQKPEKMDTLGHKIVQVIDSSGIYSVLTKEMDPEVMPHIHNDKLVEFYDSTIKGFVDAANGKIIHKKPFEIDGFKGVEIEFIAQDSTEIPNLRFARLLLLDETLITINFITWQENKETTQTVRQAFFNSLAITANKTTLTQGVDNPTAYRIGMLVGKLTGGVIVLVIVVGIVLLIRKLTSRKKKINHTEF